MCIIVGLIFFVLIFSFNLKVNSESFSTMLAQACYHFNFGYYVVHVMNMIKHEEIKPNKIFMDRLNRFDNTIKYLMKNKNKKEKNIHQTLFKVITSKKNTENFKSFIKNGY